MERADIWLYILYVCTSKVAFCFLSFLLSFFQVPGLYAYIDIDIDIDIEYSTSLLLLTFSAIYSLIFPFFQIIMFFRIVPKQCGGIARRSMHVGAVWNMGDTDRDDAHAGII